MTPPPPSSPTPPYATTTVSSPPLQPRLSSPLPPLSSPSNHHLLHRKHQLQRASPIGGFETIEKCSSDEVGRKNRVTGVREEDDLQSHLQPSCYELG
ncbi:hypothetical protein HanIR_Chr05g0241611 [Helianthus annuus]|nr:hypothetical protein HanIR_Chr05g0241611 [Helianthus annuus]